MATLHLSGTELEPSKARPPLNRNFLLAMAMTFLVAMHLFWPNPGGLGLALSFNATTWIALSFALAIGLYQMGTNRSVRYSKLTIVLLLSATMLTLPIIYSGPDITNATGRLIGLWAGLLLFLVLQQFHFTNKHKQRLLWFVILACAFQAIVGYIQFFLLNEHNWFGYDATTNRPYGIFQQPNVMASFLATGMVLSGYLLARQPQKYNRRVSDVSILYFTPMLFAPLIIVLASRTGWLSMFIGCALVLPYLYRFSTKKRFYGWIVSNIIGLVIGFVIALSSNSGNLISYKSNLDSARGTIYPQAIDMLIEKPFTGYGIGRFEPEYVLYTARQHQLNDSYPAGMIALDHPHNEILFWGVEGGLVPVLGILLAAIFVLSRIIRAKQGTRLAMFALFVPIVLHSQLEYPFYHSAIHWIIFITLIYWVDQRSSTYYKVGFGIVSKTLSRSLSLSLPIIVSTYMLTSLHTNMVLTRFEQSQPADPEILKRVSNPMAWQDRFDWAIYRSHLELGLQTGKRETLLPFVDWSINAIQRKPRPAFYQNLITAYLALGNESRARQVHYEAQFLFPHHNFKTKELVSADIVNPNQ
jgi:O-antigen polymerase